MRRLARLAAAGVIGWACAASVASAASPASIRVDGAAVALALEDGRVLTGPALAGQEIRIDALRLKVTAAVAGEGQAPWLYALSARSGASGAFRPACAPDARGRRVGVLLAGFSTPDGRFVPDPERLSVACTSGATGKCLLSGYAPDAAGLPRFQACLRMFTADYCGDGRSWTRDGTVIDVFDRDGIQQSALPHLPLEAAWAPDGAVCVHHARVPGRLSLAALRAACPRALQLPPSQCTAEQAAALHGALVFNRSSER